MKHSYSMRFFILRGARLLVPYLVLLIIYFLYRGHDEPGGGFIAGGIGGLAILVYLLSEKKLPQKVINGMFIGGVGSLSVACIGGIFAKEKTLLKALWCHIGCYHLGTPLIFDIGVFLIVVGSIALMSQSIFKKEYFE